MIDVGSFFGFCVKFFLVVVRIVVWFIFVIVGGFVNVEGVSVFGVVFMDVMRVVDGFVVLEIIMLLVLMGSRLWFVDIKLVILLGDWLFLFEVLVMVLRLDL